MIENKRLLEKIHALIRDDSDLVLRLERGHWEDIAPIIRSATLKEVGEWLVRCATVAIEHPSKNVAEATYGFKTKEWHEILSKLRKGEMPEG